MAEIMRLDWSHHDLKMLVSSDIERAYRIRACVKEPWTTDWLRTLGPGDVMVNVGANVGSYALCAAAQGARVIAIEPNILNLARLCENVLLNGMGDRVEPIHAVAAGKNSHERSVVYDDPRRGSASCAVVADNGSPRALRTPRIFLNKFVATHMLIDVDGAEVSVLSGGNSLLRTIRSVMIEMQPNTERHCSKLIKRAGLYCVGRWDERNGQPMGVVYAQWDR